MNGSIDKNIMKGESFSENKMFTVSKTNNTLSCSQLSKPSTITTNLDCCFLKESRHRICEHKERCAWSMINLADRYTDNEFY